MDEAVKHCLISNFELLKFKSASCAAQLLAIPWLSSLAAQSTLIGSNQSPFTGDTSANNSKPLKF